MNVMEKLKCINEYFAVCTFNARIMVAEFNDGTIRKEYEDYLISESEHTIKRINHCNKDKYGNYYTTEKIIKLSDYGWENWCQEYLKRSA